MGFRVECFSDLGKHNKEVRKHLGADEHHVFMRSVVKGVDNLLCMRERVGARIAGISFLPTL